MAVYEDLHRAVLAALVNDDPMGLADPDNDLADEYDAEAREIARRLVHAGGTGDAAAVASAITATFAESFDTELSRTQTHGIAVAIESRATNR